MILSIRDIFDSSGPLAIGKKNYKVREGQIEMAELVNHALYNNEHLIVEAGTGVGKSFAELVPAMVKEIPVSFEEKDGETIRVKHPIIIGTYTKALSAQLFNDALVINRLLNLDRSVLLLKGRNNYVSLKHLQRFTKKAARLNKEEIKELLTIEKWVEKTETGDINELGKRPSFWDSISCKDCTVSNCGIKDCFLRKARSDVKDADIIITNHTYIGLKYLLNEKILPEPSALIIDEAHDFQNAIKSILETQLTSYTINNFIRVVYEKYIEPRKEVGIYVPESLTDKLETLRHKYLELFERYYEGVRAYIAEDRKLSAKYRYWETIQLLTSFESLKYLEIIIGLLEGLNEIIGINYEFEYMIQSLIRRFKTMVTEDDNYIIWYEVKQNKDNRAPYTEMQIKRSPILLDGILNERLFSKEKIILTSATLSTVIDNKPTFDYLKDQLGLTNSIIPVKEQIVKSPFDYHKQCKIHVHSDLPDPRIYNANKKQIQDYYIAIGNRILLYSQNKKESGKLVLCTSYKDLKVLKELCGPILEELGIPYHYQDNGTSVEKLLGQFKKEGGYLFGTKSFWTGIDLPKEQCSHVFLTKLPFRPTDVLIEAICDKIEARGGDKWADYLIPEMLLQVKQGVGRLIRTEEDEGHMVLLDSRIMKVGYGKQVLAVLPHEAPIEEFLEFEDEIYHSRKLRT